METLSVLYNFSMAEKGSERFTLSIDAETLELIRPPATPTPEWTRLGFHICPHCPYTEKTMSRCPVALSLAEVTERFGSILSYDTVALEVVTSERVVKQTATAQRCVSSLIGLLMATSGCPHTAFFKPMARFHLPLASEAETLYRSTSMYLLSRYFVGMRDGEARVELDGLTKIYDNLQTLNRHIAKRLRAASKTDSAVNALVILDLYAEAAPYAIEDALDTLEPLFSQYIKADELG
ncbi:hypothetical protein DSLASN_44650 [Desulfoluna limicola]|uniref:Uncharacterized protein n=1 Tax=Desulfoluna limicola TaxID=2810562 RepID=A0ABN6FCQ1_9BACT|nr:hypothetical protein [Desulfoluna limicola]BCS98833.1 hypothetical protein DSLASN_44650 [Desulfoluna limicola]